MQCAHERAKEKRKRDGTGAARDGRKGPRPGWERVTVESFRGVIKPRPRPPGLLPGQPTPVVWPWPKGKERKPRPPATAPSSSSAGAATARLVRWTRGS